MIRILRINLLKSVERVKAFVDVEVNDLRINGLKVVEGKNGLYVTYPQEKRKDEKYYTIVEPMTQAVEEEISKIILEEYNKRNGGVNV